MDAAQDGGMPLTERPQRCFLRWDIHQRIQHVMLMTAFIVLMATGLPLRYAGAPTAQTITQAVGGAYAASIIHRFAAGLLVLTALYHLIYLGTRVYRKTLSSSMLPKTKDVRDFFRSIMYNLGLARERPKFGRYSFSEKFEYWGMVWGSIVMIATGSLLWNPVITSQHLPVIMLKLSRVIHSYEALLAILAIIIWHFYHAHLRPDVFPMSAVWLTGLMTEQEMKEHHPLEYEKIIGGGRDE